DGDPAAGADDDGADVPGEMVAAALEELGVPGGEVRKAQWDENKHKRDHGKFSSTGGASGGGKPHELTQIGNLGRGIADSFYDGLQDSLAKTGDVPATERRGNTKIAQAWDLVKNAGLHNHPEAAVRFAAAVREAYNSGGSGRNWTDALNKHFAGEKAAAAGGQAAKPSPRAVQVARRAKSSPAVKDQLARAHEWADQMAERHADRVAKHLGIDRSSARHVLASTIKMLCERALRGEGDDQSKTFTGAGGQKLTIGVKKKQFAGGPPRPDNPQGEGSLAPRKAMSALSDSSGGALVRPPQQGRRMRRRKGVRAVVARVLKSLESGE
ncbi:MAG TPA: hypothetical protein VM529_04390, partial [Gemmata sp.]|nr:hypothetical protein [Gemmata sp.]